MAALSPSCASEITSCTPERPRRNSCRKKSFQKVSDSLGPVCNPTIPLRPSLFTAIASVKVV